MSSYSSSIGGILEPGQLAGREYEVTLNYNIEYRLRVVAGPEEDQAVEEADLRRFADDVEPTDRMLVNSEVEKLGDVWADDPRSERILDSDGPTAPSESTFWDDTQHFSGDEIQEYSE